MTIRIACPHSDTIGKWFVSLAHANSRAHRFDGGAVLTAYPPTSICVGGRTAGIGWVTRLVRGHDFFLGHGDPSGPLELRRLPL